MTFPSSDLNGWAGILDEESPVPEAVTRDSLWRTKEGRILAIKDMGDQHLLNTIRCLREMSPIGTKIRIHSHARRRQWVNAMANEAYARGLKPDELTDGEPVHE